MYNVYSIRNTQLADVYAAYVDVIRASRISSVEYHPKKHKKKYWQQKRKK